MKTLGKIQHWLDNPDRAYYTGIDLLQEHIGETFLTRMLRKGFDNYNEQKLIEKLRELAVALEAEDKQKNEELPPELKLKQASSGDLMSERRIIRAELRTLWMAGKVDEEHFRTQAYRILDITDELNKSFGDIQFFKQHGVVAGVPEEEQSPKNLYNLRTYLTKYQKALDKGKTLKGVDLKADKRAEYEARVKNLTIEIAAIEADQNYAKITVSID